MAFKFDQQKDENMAQRDDAARGSVDKLMLKGADHMVDYHGPPTHCHYSPNPYLI